VSDSFTDGKRRVKKVKIKKNGAIKGSKRSETVEQMQPEQPELSSGILVLQNDQDRPVGGAEVTPPRKRASTSFRLQLRQFLCQLFYCTILSSCNIRILKKDRGGLVGGAEVSPAS
ncbi:hypothetical protein Tcan_00921, partial [Toxocara canis]